MTKAILEIRNLKKHFNIEPGIFGREVKTLRAVDGINFTVKRRETLGLVGESGCGKTTVALTLLGLYKPTAGEVFFAGKNIFQLPREEMRKIRCDMQIIFQDPHSSLNPRMSVYSIVGEALGIRYAHLRGEERKRKVMELMERVGLRGYQIHRYPHQFSGGEKQRIGIARALAVEPNLVIADEAVSALDVSVRAKILNLLQDLKKEYKLTILFISHDLSVVKHICDRVAVMYLGKIVEFASKRELFANPQHPYTEALLSAIPIPNPRIKRKRIILKGGVPTPIDPPPGCRFHPRCLHASSVCSMEEPELIEIASKKKHYVACHLKRE